MIYDVIIIGGGVVGTLTARALSRYHLKIALVEAADDVATGATKANSAIVHGGYDPLPGTLKATLNVKGTAMMPALCADLDVPYIRNGSMVLAFSEEETEHLHLLYQRGLTNAVPGLFLLDKTQLHTLEPSLSPKAIAALHCENAGIVSPYELAIAAMGNAMDNGAHLFCDYPVDAIEKTNEGFLVKSGDKSLTCRYLINAAGIYGGKIAAMLGEDISLTPRIGEYLLFDHVAADLVSHTIFQTPTKAGKGILVTPTVHGNLLIGPTSVLSTDPECKDTTKEGMNEVWEKAEKSLPNLPFREVISAFAGIRAVPPEDDFIIRPVKAHPTAFHAIGIESPGLSASPAIAEMLVDLLKKAGLTLTENSEFDPHRTSPTSFSTLTSEEKNAIIRQDPAFGRIVCRCEKVTEGQIMQAITQNPPARSVDAVKRRVRSSMGRCQGGFCTPTVLSLLAKHYGVDKTQIKKSSGNSYLLTSTLDQAKEGNTNEAN